MSINTVKGQRIDVTKANPGLKKYTVGLGWDPQASSGQDFDLDASVFILGSNNKLLSEKHMVFYNNLKSPNDAVIHNGDNRTGAGAGDDETIDIDFSKLEPEAEKIVIVVTIHECMTRRQNFGMVKDAYARLLNGEDKTTEIARYDLAEDYSTETSINFVELYKKDGEWKMNATGTAAPSTLDEHIALYTV